MIFLLQAGLNKVLNKIKRQDIIVMDELEFIPYNNYCFYEIDIEDKIEDKNDLIPQIHNIIATQVKYNYADLIVSFPFVTMKDVLTMFNYEIAKFQYYYLHNREYLKIFLKGYKIEEWLTIKVIDDISIYPVTVGEYYQDTLLEFIQSKDNINNEYIEAIKRSFNNDNIFIQMNNKRFREFKIDLMDNSLPNLYDKICDFISELKNTRKIIK
ncbi:MAG: hypothetical protein IJK61_04935 [Bacteroidetes bacterium]|nr:hypothetical protein [Bacteroidota bacterium]